jgi:hypothetical protein
LTSLLGWSEKGCKIFSSEVQQARYAKRCEYINRTLCKKIIMFEKFFDDPSQLFISQYNAT